MLSGNFSHAIITYFTIKIGNIWSNNIDKTKLTYWLQKYDEQNGKESLYFNIQDDELCAILHLTINDWNKLEDVRERKGIGRRGAEFTNLKFEIIKDSVSTEFIYKTFDRIID